MPRDDSVSNGILDSSAYSAKLQGWFPYLAGPFLYKLEWAGYPFNPSIGQVDWSYWHYTLSMDQMQMQMQMNLYPLVCNGTRGFHDREKIYFDFLYSPFFYFCYDTFFLGKKNWIIVFEREDFNLAGELDLGIRYFSLLWK